MKRFFSILLVASLLIAPIIQACPTCYGKTLVEKGYSKKQINSQQLHDKVMQAMKDEQALPQQPTVMTQSSKFISSNKQPQQPPRHRKIGSSHHAITSRKNPVKP